MITKAQYADMHDPPGGLLQLHHGEVVFFPYPKGQHTCAQVNLVDRLKPSALGRGKVIMELPFCPLPEHEVWAADVAYISPAQWAAGDEDDWFRGSPLLVIEVLSPSNTTSEVADKRQTADPINKTVQTWTADGATTIHNESDSIPLTIMGAPPLPVSAIFEED